MRVHGEVTINDGKTRKEPPNSKFENGEPKNKRIAPTISKIRKKEKTIWMFHSFPFSIIRLDLYTVHVYSTLENVYNLRAIIYINSELNFGSIVNGSSWLSIFFSFLSFSLLLAGTSSWRSAVA